MKAFSTSVNTKNPIIHSALRGGVVLFLFALLAISHQSAIAQVTGVGISDNPAFTPSPKAVLDLGTTNPPKGFIVPRMTAAQRNALCTGTPDADCVAAGGLLVYQTTAPEGYYVWDGGAWHRILDDNFSLDEVDPTWHGDADLTGSIRREGNVGIGLTAGAAAERLQVTGNVLLSRGATRQIRVQAASGNNDPGNSLEIKAGNPAGVNSAAGGHLILEAGSGYSGFSAKGGNVVVRSGGNDFSTAAINNGHIIFETGRENFAESIKERMRIRADGKVIINDLATAGVKIVTADGTGEIAGIGGGTGDQVLKMNTAGTAIEWGSAALDIPATTHGQVLYYNGTDWVALGVPGVATDPTATWAFTLPNAGQGQPVWVETTSLNVSGDDLGNHTATQDLDLNGNSLRDDDDGVVDVDGNLLVNGKINSDGIQETSDARFKKDVVSIPDALSTVNSLRGVTYHWRTEEFAGRGFSAEREMGVIAQEVEILVPEVVNTDKDGFKSVQYGHLVPLLIEAIKEQQAIIDNQSAEISALKGVKEELDVLKASVELISEHIRTSQK